MVLRCCVPRCESKGRFGFHKFPRDEGHCFKWQTTLRKRNISSKYLPYSSYRVCEKHFKKEDYIHHLGKTLLIKTAVPSIRVPENVSVYGEHNYTELHNGNEEELVVDKIATDQIEDSTKSSTSSTQVNVDNDDDEPFGEIILPEIAIDLEPYLEDVGPETEKPQVSGTADKPETQKANQPSVQATIKKDKIPEHVHRQLRYKDNRIKTLQNKLKETNNLGKEKVIVYLNKHFNKDRMTFFEMQLRNCGKKNHGQRYTTEKKVMMLSIYKRGPRAYNFLSKLFGLPCRRTLCRQSAQLQFETGVNVKLFELLKLEASEMSASDRYCTIGWDEVALTHHLTYSDVGDCIDGFVDFGDTRIPDFATHALTFMIRGVSRSYKQPVAYFFTQNLNGIQLADIIKLVIRAVLKTGLKIIGSVSDQTGIMAAAVNRLINPHSESTKQIGQLLCYEIDGNKIIHCFDPPYVLKTLRNNLQTKNLKHCVNGLYNPNHKQNENTTDKESEASWDDIRDLYDFDMKNSSRLLPKITKVHIDVETEKMKVSNAAQIFSKACGSIMLFCSQQHLFPKDCSGTAYILLFVNDVFDSLNGGGKPVENTFRGPITEKKVTGDVNNRSSVIPRTISTIKGYMELTKLCFSLGLKSISLRQMNQDGLENFFGSVRGVCHNPNAVIPPQFRSGYTNLVLNNLTAKHSIGGNCEEDSNTSLLKNVYELYDVVELSADKPNEINTNTSPEESNDDDTAVDLEISIDQLSELKFIKNEALILESSNTCKLISSSTKCDLCKCTIEAYCPLSAHRAITATDSNIPVRTYPTMLFMSRFKLVFKTVETILPFISHEKHLVRKLLSSLENIDFDGIGCKEHESEIAHGIKKATAKVCVTNYLRQINGILSKKITEPIPGQSQIHGKAFAILKKKKGIGKFGQQPI